MENWFTGLGNYLQGTLQNPLFQGGLGLATEGMGGMQKGIQAGAQFSEMQRQQEQRKAIEQLMSRPDFGKGIDPRVMQLAQATRDPSMLSKVLMPSEQRAAEMHPVEMDLARAKAEKFRREAANGGEMPSNVREYKFFNGLSPEDQQKYLTMKRAEKYLDTGTGFVRPNPVAPGGPPVATIQKDIAGKAAQQAQGTEQGKALVDLPKVRQNATTTLKYIDDVLRDPNLGNVTGAQGWLPTVRSTSRDTEARIAQLGGRAFLSAFESLKGGGQITEIEGKKATEALARLTDLKQSDAGYKKALEDFRNEVITLVQIAEQRAQGAGPYVPPPGQYSDGVPRQSTGRLPSTPGWSIKRVD